jgi:hypothetical protein
MRHPRFRHRLPSTPVNFFRRLPARTDSMLWSLTSGGLIVVIRRNIPCLLL